MRDECGGGAECGTSFSLSMFDVSTAEAMALRWGLKLARAQGKHKVIVKCDNLSIISALNQKSSG